MKKLATSLLAFALIFISACEPEVDEDAFFDIRDVKLNIKFATQKSSFDELPMTYQTPSNYIVALKKAALLGVEGTPDFTLFETQNMTDALVFDFTDEGIKHSLLEGSQVPNGKYANVLLDIYYLQMRVQISTGDRGVEYRNLRIYLSDDNEYQNGLHQPGDITQINESGEEIGWLMGAGQDPNLDPVTPRTAAYTHNGDGTTWYDFNGKDAQYYGPFGDVDFMNNATHPVYTSIIYLARDEITQGDNLIVEFNVNNCWAFQDKNTDGYFGFSDLDPINPTKWHLAMPLMRIYRE